jgi:hypothetical protein
MRVEGDAAPRLPPGARSARLRPLTSARLAVASPQRPCAPPRALARPNCPRPSRSCIPAGRPAQALDGLDLVRRLHVIQLAHRVGREVRPLTRRRLRTCERTGDPTQSRREQFCASGLRGSGRCRQLDKLGVTGSSPVPPISICVAEQRPLGYAGQVVVAVTDARIVPPRVPPRNSSAGARDCGYCTSRMRCRARRRATRRRA